MMLNMTKEISNSVADEDCYPYEAAVGRCRAKKNSNLRTMQCEIPSNNRDSLYKMGPAYSLNNETDIMWEISTYGPVQGDIKFFKFLTVIEILNSNLQPTSF